MSVVLGEGLEPSRLAAPEPKSGVSANFTTRAEKPYRFSLDVLSIHKTELKNIS